MSFNYKSLLPTPAQIKAEFPLTPECVELKVARDKEVADVITGKSEKFLVIIGPCSADREDAVCEYMSRLAKVNEQVKDKLVIVPRVYTNKPRSSIRSRQSAIRSTQCLSMVRPAMTRCSWDAVQERCRRPALSWVISSLS